MLMKAQAANSLNSIQRCSPSGRRALHGPTETPATRLGIFVSSVQKELAEERRAVKSFVESDPLLRRKGLTKGSMGSSVCEVAAYRMRHKCAKRSLSTTLRH